MTIALVNPPGLRSSSLDMIFRIGEDRPPPGPPGPGPPGGGGPPGPPGPGLLATFSAPARCSPSRNPPSRAGRHRTLPRGRSAVSSGPWSEVPPSGRRSWPLALASVESGDRTRRGRPGPAPRERRKPSVGNVRNGCAETPRSTITSSRPPRRAPAAGRADRRPPSPTTRCGSIIAGKGRLRRPRPAVLIDGDHPGAEPRTR